MKTHLKTHKSGLKIEFSQDFKSLNPDFGPKMTPYPVGYFSHRVYT